MSRLTRRDLLKAGASVAAGSTLAPSLLTALAPATRSGAGDPERSPLETDSPRERLRLEPKLERTWQVELADAAGRVHAAFTKTLHIRRQDMQGGP